MTHACDLQSETLKTGDELPILLQLDHESQSVRSEPLTLSAQLEKTRGNPHEPRIGRDDVQGPVHIVEATGQVGKDVRRPVQPNQIYQHLLHPSLLIHDAPLARTP